MAAKLIGTGSEEDSLVNLKEVVRGELYEIALFIDGHAAGRHMSRFYLRCTPNATKYVGQPEDWEQWPVSIVNEKEVAKPLVPERVSGTGDTHPIPIKKWVVCHFRARRTGVAAISEIHKKLENWYMHRWDTNPEHHDFELSIVIDKVPANKIKHIYASFRVHLAWRKEKDKTVTAPVDDVPKHIPLPPNDTLNEWTYASVQVKAEPQPTMVANGFNHHQHNICVPLGQVAPPQPQGDLTVSNFLEQWEARQAHHKLKYEQELSNSPTSPSQEQFYQFQVQQLQSELQYPASFSPNSQYPQQNPYYQSPLMTVTLPVDQDDLTYLSPPQGPYSSDMDMDLSWYPGTTNQYGLDFQSNAVDYPLPELYSDLLPDSMDIETKQNQLFEFDKDVQEANTLYIWPMGIFDGVSDQAIVNYAYAATSGLNTVNGIKSDQKIIVCIPDVKGHGDILVKASRALLKRFGIRELVTLWNIVLNDTLDVVSSSKESPISEAEKVEIQSRALVNSILSVALLAKKNPQQKYILLLSWSCTENFKPFEKAIVMAQSQGVLIISAAGNRGIDLSLHPEYPSAGNMKNVLTVGSLTRDRVPAVNSNYRSILVDSFPFVWAPGAVQIEKSDQCIQTTSIAATFLSIQASYQWLHLLHDKPKSTWRDLLKSIIVDNLNTYIWTKYLKPVPSLTEVLPPGPVVIWVDTGNPMSFLSTLAIYCERNNLVSVHIFRFVHSAPLFQFLAQRRKELNQKSNQNVLRFVSNRYREKDGGASAGKDFYEALRKDPDYKKSPFLLFCGIPEQAGIPNDPEQRLWVSNDARFAFEFVSMQSLPGVPDHNWKLLRGPMILTGVVRGMNLAQLTLSSNVPSSPTTRQQPQQQSSSNAIQSQSDESLGSVISSLSIGSSNTFYVKISFNDDSKESVSSSAVEGITEVYEWNFFHKKQIVPTLSLLPGTSSPPTSPRASSSSSSSSSGAVPTVVTFDVYLRKKRNILPSVLFGDTKDTLLASTNVDLRALTDQQVTQMWLPLASVPTASSTSVPMQGVPKLLVKVLKLAAGRVLTQPEFEAVDPLPEGVVSMTTEL